MAPTTVAASKANTYLVGKKFAELETLEGTMNALEQDFDLDFRSSRRHGIVQKVARTLILLSILP